MQNVRGVGKEEGEGQSLRGRRPAHTLVLGGGGGFYTFPIQLTHSIMHVP